MFPPTRDTHKLIFPWLCLFVVLTVVEYEKNEAELNSGGNYYGFNL